MIMFIFGLIMNQTTVKLTCWSCFTAHESIVTTQTCHATVEERDMSIPASLWEEKQNECRGIQVPLRNDVTSSTRNFTEVNGRLAHWLRVVRVRVL